MCSAYKVLINSETKWYTMVATLLQSFISPEENNCWITFHFLSLKFRCIYKLLLVCFELHKCVWYICLDIRRIRCSVFVTWDLFLQIPLRNCFIQGKFLSATAKICQNKMLSYKPYNFMFRCIMCVPLRIQVNALKTQEFR